MKNPNVVLMIAHDLGRHLGCCGVRTVSSPNADALAAESALFTSHFCTAPQCSPSRAAIMTGRYPHSNGMLGLAHKPFNWKLNAGERHVAERFGRAGYRTVLCGHQHVTQEPKSVGFGEVIGSGGENALEVGRAAADFLSSRSPKKPLYMQVGFFEPHRPWDWKGISPDDSKGVYIPGYLPDTPEARGEFAALQGAVRRMDEGLGLVMDAVRAHMPAENTVVVFTTDHGIAMFRAKCTLYDSGIETAFILRAPGVKSGARDELVSNVDVLPTLLELAGLPPAASAQGASLAPLLRGEAFTPRSEVFAEMSFHTAYTPMRAVRTAGWKLIRSFEHSWPVDVPTDIQRGPLYGAVIKDHVGHRPYAELYDLRADPLEQHDLAEKPEHAGVLADLSARLLRWMSETDDFLLTGPVPSPFYHESLRRLQEDAARAC